MICALKVAFVLVGFFFSLFYALKAVDIFVDTDHEFIQKKKAICAWRFHQRWLNFICSAIGWAVGYYYLFIRLPQSGYTFKIEDTILILIVLLGIIGFLPNALSKITSLRG